MDRLVEPLRLGALQRNVFVFQSSRRVGNRRKSTEEGTMPLSALSALPLATTIVLPGIIVVIIIVLLLIWLL